jgi:flagellar motility protein MotE (MotC chaperone)
MRFVRDLRLIPVVALAAAALFVLKAAAIVIEGGYTLIASRAALAQGLGTGPLAIDLPAPAALDDAAPAPRGDRAKSWVREIYDAPDYTGSVAAPKPDAAAAAPPKGQAPASGATPAAETGGASGAPAPLDTMRPTMSAGERAVLESLQQRRQELETRARELEVRDSLLKAAEKRIEQRLQELKDMEQRLTGAEKKKDDAEAAKFKSLVTMYENMKAKDAAKVFDRLNLRILVEVVNAMNPRRMSDILGLMTPEVAERLTIEIANRSGAIDKAPQPVELPKIEGRPNRS